MTVQNGEHLRLRQVLGFECNPGNKQLDLYAEEGAARRRPLDIAPVSSAPLQARVSSVRDPLMDRACSTGCKSANSWSAPLERRFWGA